MAAARHGQVTRPSGFCTTSVKPFPNANLRSGARGGRDGRERSSAFRPGLPLPAIPYSLFPIPYSLFPIPYSLFPIPCSLLLDGCGSARGQWLRTEHGGAARIANADAQLVRERGKAG
jgi:hypothetical protein